MVVDDHDVVRRAVTLLLEAGGGIEVCGQARTVAEAGLVAEMSDPDVAVVDLRLSDGSGVYACREIRARCPHAQVVLLTARSDADALAAAVISGASTYLLKELRGPQIVHTVQAAAGADRQLDAKIVDAVLLTLGVMLSEEERVLLALLAQGRTDVEIAQDREVDEVTAKVLVADLLAKLGVGGNPTLSRRAALPGR